jgi:hypothetical protein
MKNMLKRTNYQKKKQNVKEPHHLPNWILHLARRLSQLPRPQSTEDPTGLFRENFFGLRPSPPPSCHKNEKQQRRSKIRRTQKVVLPDNHSFPDEVTLSSPRTTRSKKMKPKRNYRVPPYPARKPGTKILPSVRGCGGGPPLSGAGVPVIRGESKSAFPASVTPDLDLSLEGSPNPPQRQASILPEHSTLPPGPHHAFAPSHWNCPFTTDSFLFPPRRSNTLIVHSKIKKPLTSHFPR